MSPVLTLLSENWAPLSNLRTGLSHFPSVTSMIVSCSGPSDTSSSFKKRDDAYFLIFAILTFPFPCWRPLLSESAQPCAKADARESSWRGPTEEQPLAILQSYAASRTPLVI